MIDKNKLIYSEWITIEDYLKKDNADSLKLAILEAEKLFKKVLQGKNYKGKKEEELLLNATKELRSPELFIKSREKALLIRDKFGFDLEDPYSGVEIVKNYKEAIEDLLFGIIDGKKNDKIKFRFWNIYYYFFYNRKKIFKILLWALGVVFLMLFIADTETGKNIFYFLIEKIHLIIRIILVVFILLFLVLFFITLCIIALESRFKKRMSKR